jgi:hypothetical protein
VDPNAGWLGAWSPGIGDPTVVGWLTASLYLIASLLCFHAAGGPGAPTPAAGAAPDRTERPSLATALALAFVGAKGRLMSLPPRVRGRALWLGLGIVLLLLGINKQLDLQTAVTGMGRKLAVTYGWYASRRRLEAIFLAGVALGGLALVRVVFLLARAEPRGIRAVLTGAAFLVVFVVVRAASFHHVDELLHVDLAESPVNGVLEVGSLCFIITGTYRVLRLRRPPRTR